MLVSGRFRALILIITLLGLAGCAGRPNVSAARPGEIFATHQIVAAAHPLAVEAGRTILRQGGSAVDAAIAVQLVLTLVEPQSSGIGGGGFLLHYDAKTGAIESYDGRETAPAAAKPDMFLGPDGQPLQFYDAVVGGLSVGVPGALRMLEQAHREHGKLPWAQLFAPAVKLAQDGFPVSPRLAQSIAGDDYLGKQPTTAPYFFPEGKALAAGTVLRNAPLAETLQAIAVNGADDFYKGPVAQDIVAAVKQATPRAGGMTEADLAAYHAVKRPVPCILYRVYRVCGMGPSSSGGITVLQILGILQSFDMAAEQPMSLPAVHRFAEASRLAFADRDRYIGDPDFVNVPIAGMLDAKYLAARSALIHDDAAIKDAQPGRPAGDLNVGASQPPQFEPVSTSHMVIVDRDGNIVTFTTTVENAFGARVMVDGFLLNNQLTDFSFRPEADGRPVANRAAAGKRPRSSLSPVLVFDAASGAPLFALGSPGGANIIDYVAEALVGLLDWHLSPAQAAALPHVINRNGPTLLEADKGLEDLGTRLTALGHTVKFQPFDSGLNIVALGGNGMVGASDPRREGVALGD